MQYMVITSGDNSFWYWIPPPVNGEFCSGNYDSSGPIVLQQLAVPTVTPRGEIRGAVGLTAVEDPHTGEPYYQMTDPVSLQKALYGCERISYGYGQIERCYLNISRLEEDPKFVESEGYCALVLHVLDTVHTATIWMAWDDFTRSHYIIVDGERKPAGALIAPRWIADCMEAVGATGNEGFLHISPSGTATDYYRPTMWGMLKDAGYSLDRLMSMNPFQNTYELNAIHGLRDRIEIHVAGRDYVSQYNPNMDYWVQGCDGLPSCRAEIHSKIPFLCLPVAGQGEVCYTLFGVYPLDDFFNWSDKWFYTQQYSEYVRLRMKMDNGTITPEEMKKLMHNYYYRDNIKLQRIYDRAYGIPEDLPPAEKKRLYEQRARQFREIIDKLTRDLP